MAFDIEKLRTIGHLKGGRTMSRTTSGREHPESGLPYQKTRDELGNEVTEHGAAGSGVSQRQDVHIHADPIRVDTAAKGPGE